MDVVKTVEAWHFMESPDHDGRFCIRAGQGTRAGETVSFEGELEMRRSGLHVTTRPTFAVGRGGPWVARVELSVDDDETLRNDRDDYCGRHLKILWAADAWRTLHDFALWCAESVLIEERALGRTNPKLWAGMAVKRRWLDGNASNMELSIAWESVKPCPAFSVEQLTQNAMSLRPNGGAYRAGMWETIVHGWDMGTRSPQDEELERRLWALKP